MLAEAGGERSGALIALAIVGAQQLGLPISELGNDVGLALASPLKDETRKGLVAAYYGAQAQPADEESAPPPARRQEPPGGNDDPPPLEFRC
jgi:hypothetical protein